MSANVSAGCRKHRQVLTRSRLSLQSRLRSERPQAKGRERSERAARRLLEGNFAHDLSGLEKLLVGQSDVSDDLAEKNRRDVSTAVERYCCLAAVWMAEMLVGAPLPDLFEAKRRQNRDDLSGLQNRQASHRITPLPFECQ